MIRIGKEALEVWMKRMEEEKEKQMGIHQVYVAVDVKNTAPQLE